MSSFNHDQSFEIVSRTLRCFETISFEDFSESWIKEVFDNDFTQFDNCDLSPDTIFAEDGVETLQALIKIFNIWANRHSENVNTSIDDNASEAENESFQSSDVLWAVFKDNGIDVKHILSLVYLLCFRSTSISASFPDKMLGLYSSQLYLTLLRVPGSIAYSAYYQNLVRLCLNCIKFPKEKTQQGKKKGPPSAYRNDVVSQRRRVNRQDMADDDMETDDADVADLIEVEFNFRECEKIMTEFSAIIKALIALLRKVSFAKEVDMIEHTLQKLVECATFEDSNTNLKFDIEPAELDRRKDNRLSSSYIISSLAYRALILFLESDRQGNKRENYLLILRYLMDHILCSRVKTPQITVKYQIIKDNVVSFVCHNINSFREISVTPTIVLLQQMCLRVNDKSDFRAKASLAITMILYCLPQRKIAEMVKWLNVLVETNKIQNRIIALEIFAQMITRSEKVSCTDVPSNLVVYTTLLPVANSILLRCHDKASSVRTRAINLMSQNMMQILKVLENKNNDVVAVNGVDANGHCSGEEDEEDENEADRSCYLDKEKTHSEKLDLIVQMLIKRTKDPIVTVRKAALLAMQNLIEFDRTYLREENLNLFPKASTDPNIAVRKQTVQSVTILLEVYRDSTEIQECWLKTVLTLVFDPEKSVQAKCLEVMEEKFLVDIFSAKDDKKTCAWNLVLRIVSGDLILLQRYLRKAFSIWKSEEKLRPQMAVQLEKCFVGEREAGVWFLLSMLTANLDIRNPTFVLSYCEKYITQEVPPLFMGNVLQALGSACKRIPAEKLKEFQNLLENKFRNFDFPVELIADATEVYYKIQLTLQEENSEFSAFFAEIMQKCVEILSHYALEEHPQQIYSDDEIQKYLFTLGELSQLYPAKIPNKAIFIIKSIIASPSIEGENANLATSVGKTMSPRIRAYAFVTLGKMCLQNESLTKELIPALAKELVVSKHAIIRNNVIVVMIDMCTRYTSYVDLYIPLISACLKDEQFLVRRQTLTFLIKLLQEDYIKWKGTLFHRMLTAIIDEEPTIKSLAEYSLGYLLFQRKPNIFSDNFIDCIFLFNNYIPPNSKKLMQNAKEMQSFNLRGAENMDKRMMLYKFMLEHTVATFRVQLYLQIGSEILSAIAENILPLNEDSEGVIKDSLAIISTQEMKSLDNPTANNASDEATGEEGDESEATNNDNVLQEKHRLLFIEPIVPAIISLKNLLVANKSPLVEDIMLFLRDFLKDYKSELKTILASDKQLANEIEFDMRQFEAQEKRKLQEAKERELAAKAQQHRNALANEGSLLQSVEKARSVGRLRRSAMINSAAEHASSSQTPMRNTTRQAFMQPIVLCKRLENTQIGNGTCDTATDGSERGEGTSAGTMATDATAAGSKTGGGDAGTKSDADGGAEGKTKEVEPSSPSTLSPTASTSSYRSTGTKRSSAVHLPTSTPFIPATRLRFDMHEDISEIEPPQNSTHEDMDIS